MGKSSGGGGGGGKGKSISGGGNSGSQSTTASTTPRFTPEEQTAINNTVEKLKALPKEQRDRQLKQMRESLQSRLEDSKKAESDALRRQAEWVTRNPNTSPERNHFTPDVEKAQTRLKAAKHDWNKFVTVNNALAGK